MKKLFTGFSMAWGMFLAIPNPVKRWDEAAKPLMLAFLPVMGLVVGLLWALLAFLLGKLGLVNLFGAALMTLLPFLLSGFIHLDGFMDCCDAMLSRRPLEERRRILKDSHTGAFAVISLVFLLLIEFSLLASADFSARVHGFIAIPASSRCVSALFTSLSRPMETSGYAKMRRSRSCTAAIWAMLAVSVALPVLFLGTHGLGAPVAALFSCLAALGAKKNLAGMSGDVSGFALTIGEAAGIAALAIF